MVRITIVCPIIWSLIETQCAVVWLIMLHHQENLPSLYLQLICVPQQVTSCATGTTNKGGSGTNLWVADPQLLLVHGTLNHSCESWCFYFPPHSSLLSGIEKGSATFGCQVWPIPFFGGIGHKRHRAKSHLQIVWTCLTKLPGFVFSSPTHNCENLLFTVAWDQLHLLKALGLKLNSDFVCRGWWVGLANYRLVMLALTSWPLSTI